MIRLIVCRNPVRDHHPLKQGLRQMRFKCTDKNLVVRDHHPLKQGLRPLLALSAVSAINVRDHHPLKQGLRLKQNNLVFHFRFCQRPSSTKTRIKTVFVSHVKP